MASSSDVIVVGAGAWGLPTALQLQDRGHSVTLIDRFAIGSRFASSGGSTRLWRLADTHRWRARAMVGTLRAMERLSDRLGEPVFQRTGMLWRDDVSLPDVAEALASIDAGFQEVDADGVGDVFPGLRPDGRGALFVEDAGIVHADRLLGGALAAFEAAGGTYLPWTRVREVVAADRHVFVRLEDAADLWADQLVLAAGPGTPELLPGLGLRLPLRPVTEQVVYFGSPGGEPVDLPGLVDVGVGDAPGIYAMPNGSAGYKVGLDLPLRFLAEGTLGEDLDRHEDPARTESIRARVERDLTAVPSHVLAAQVCTWTDSGDGDFVVGRIHPRIVLACGDSGEGFKYAAFMGEYLADLVEHGAGDAEFQRHWDPHRFGADPAMPEAVSAIGRH
ncbi:NAD(P)/FAD-dependent oxidoreductase [Microbacterium sp. ASV49]|uniref:FAD-dependent oxidoreductase n=1 Tax=Microbacterium candidum TaxID=3041922 RepID=A0ABT7MXK2_9MICO|nr:FAD-dependent oxidoreductase [Microbacterium sp. ASV49]MDL9979180.1 FAD-dependent oxidoreductase [Microbacterium sp. ASV49]